MSCPDINLFIDQLEQGRLDPELQAHLDACVACRERIWVVQALPAALRPELVVPERTVQRGKAGILAGQRIEEARSRRWAVAATAGLAVLTTLAAIVFTGATAGAEPGALALYALVVGLGAGAYRGWELRHPPAPPLAPPGFGAA